tara:strand:- start:249 stop:1055 length:807 start_codon:yes stop_codon:yes gene_type:complete
MNPQLQKILDDRKKKLSVVSPGISDIHDRTVRAEKNLVAGEKEFVTRRGKYIDKGTLYHIHYTNDNKSYYMTGGEHNERTSLIFRTDVSDSDRDYYNILNRQDNLKIESKATLPTDDDYLNGMMRRYFAKKTNESSSPAFEVSADDFQSSPLYDYVSINWNIKGNKEEVLKKNRFNVAVASKKIPNVGKLLPNYQYYRSDEVLTNKEDIQNRLGITPEQDTQEPVTKELDVTLRRGSKRGIGRMKVNREAVRRLSQSRRNGGGGSSSY